MSKGLLGSKWKAISAKELRLLEWQVWKNLTGTDPDNTALALVERAAPI